MKKYIALMLALCMVVSFAACGKKAEEPAPAPVATEAPAATEAPVVEEAPAEVMTYEEYVAAELDSQVIVDCYVQATQSWWEDKITVYAADEDGAYFIYELACAEEDAAFLADGAGIRVTGYKAEWAGEVEIVDATWEPLSQTYVAEPIDATALLGTEELINYQNQLASFKGLTVENIAYKNDEPGDDIYLTLSLDGQNYEFCVERYLTDPESAVYTTVGELQVGDVVDVEGFLYWYEGVNPHITAIAKAAEPMTYAEYVEAELDSQVTVECYVQNTQSWWEDKITVYAADEDGAYFLYELNCSEEDAAKLVPGTGIRVTGYKTEWAGEVEIINGSFEFIEGSYVAEPMDATALLGTEELIGYQNRLASFTGLTVEAIAYKNDAPGDDIYLTLSKDGVNYEFCVERYLTDPESAVYTTVGELAVGDTVNVEGFLYWYEGVNPHITAIEKA